MSGMDFAAIRETNRKWAQRGSAADRFRQGIDGGQPIDETRLDALSIRNEFGRDRDRIIYAKAFRRLEHKAQIYSHARGDHYRTRLTHTLEVSQIARSIARNLGLNDDLAEAIALGHDIGHTPFGHQGERVLDEVMSGREDLGDKLRYKINYGGFKHNFHSVKVLDRLEAKYDEFKGLNLTWQVLEGILKHTRIRRHKEKDCSQCGECWDIDRFCDHAQWLKVFMGYRFSVTLEGQIVAIADEIAQRQHDLDDGLRDERLGLSFEEVVLEITQTVEAALRQLGDESNPHARLLIKLRERLAACQKRQKPSNQKKALVRDIIDYFLSDVTLTGIERLTVMDPKEVIPMHQTQYFTHELIGFSEPAKILNDAIDRYIVNRVLNSYEVNRFDGKAIFIIKQLYKAYYTNPRQMPKGILDRLTDTIKQHEGIYSLQFANGVHIGDLDFERSSRGDIELLLKLLKLEILTRELKLPGEWTPSVEGEGFFSEADLKRVSRMNGEAVKESGNTADRFLKALVENHYAYMEVICDYIAGMTDNFAMEEYGKLYLVE